MTVIQLAQCINRLATYKINDLEFQVEIIDARSVYGRDQVKIIPVYGNGEKWVMIESIRWAS